MERSTQRAARRPGPPPALRSAGPLPAPPTSASSASSAPSSAPAACPGSGGARAAPWPTRSATPPGSQPTLTCLPIPASGIFDHLDGTTFFLDANGSLLLSYELPESVETAVVELPAAAVAALRTFLDQRGAAQALTAERRGRAWPRMADVDPGP